jgi:hypothetical protein
VDVSEDRCPKVDPFQGCHQYQEKLLCKAALEGLSDRKSCQPCKIAFCLLSHTWSTETSKSDNTFTGALNTILNSRRQKLGLPCQVSIQKCPWSLLQMLLCLCLLPVPCQCAILLL